MIPKEFDSLTEASNYLTQHGFPDNFQTKENCFHANYSNKDYEPNELKIKETYRFEGMTNPSDQSVLFAIEAKDGTKGTLLISYSAKHGQNMDLIKKLE